MSVLTPATRRFIESDELAEDALNAAAKLIQERLGVDSGDVAAHFFSNGVVRYHLAMYIETEKNLLEKKSHG